MQNFRVHFLETIPKAIAQKDCFPAGLSLMKIFFPQSTNLIPELGGNGWACSWLIILVVNSIGFHSGRVDV
jgi:hypothetical protein